MGEYIPSAPVNDEAKKRNGSLPGIGGVFNVVNLHVYHYAGNNPVKYTDPDGRTESFPDESSQQDAQREKAQEARSQSTGSNNTSVSIHTVKGEVREGVFRADGSVSVGYAESMVRLQVNLKDEHKGKGMVGAFGKASAVNATGRVGVETDTVAVSLKGVGDLGTTVAQAGVQCNNTGIGIALEGRASAATGRATVEFEVFGFQVEVGVAGHLLSASATFVAGYFNQEGFKLRLGASLGAGGDVLLRVRKK